MNLNSLPFSMEFISHFTAVSLFALGLIGFLIRKNALIVLMSLELMLNAVNLLLVEISAKTNSPDGYILVIFVMTIAAGEVAVGLGILLNLYRFKNTVELDSFRQLQG